ncbi:trimeric intracellular cation channel family protein [Falsarthrobacter nasiphocae]|uniref:Membrane protein YeiH n=1 Tax=Falsarthrobacter nasiphocae TaxID=189863 RepID=A0AAE3YFY0_9MICC|nr:trimeric intracellular cation channel family protein [Falsarthrobacter nasiphocae]MDR6892440.1 putative membrane protein YeiH [Falsarthrobacter nasiphocae]
MTLSLAADLLGVYFFAVSGSLMAARREFDIIGSLFLASLVGLGGGVVRDLIINVGVPNSFANPVYLAPVALAALSVYAASTQFLRQTNWLLVADAAGLALFCISGTSRALQHGLHPISAVLLGVTTAVGGGVLRDVVANETPSLFNRHDIYAIPALVGAALTAALWGLGAYNLVTGFVVAASVFVFRIAAHRGGWQAPLSVHARSAAAAVRVSSRRA